MKRFLLILALSFAVFGGNVMAQSGTLTIAQSSDPQSLDPIDTFLLSWGMIGGAIFDGLVHRDFDMNIEPALATSWEWVGDDADRIRFHLREGVVFHNGQPFTAEDVKFTFERLLGDEGKKGAQQSNYTSIGAIEIIDDYTVDMVLASPDPIIITKLAGYGAMIVPAGYTSEVDEATFNRAPIGTGPFKVVEYVNDSHLTLAANEDYYRGVPQLAGVVYRFIPEASTRVSELLAGRVDVVQGVPISLSDSVEKSADAEIHAVGSPTISAIRFNTCLSPTDDVRVRQAIAHAIDRQGIIDVILEGYGTPVTSFQSAQSLGYDPDMEFVEYNPEKARALLAEAGVAAGTEFQLDFQGSDAVFREVAQVVAALLDEVGISLKLSTHESNIYNNEIVPENRVGQMYYSGWGGWTLDFDNTSSQLYYTGQFRNPCFSDAEIDNLVDLNRSTMVQAEREAYLQAVARRAQELMIDIPLYQHQNLWGVANRVSNFVAPSDDRNFLFEVSVDN